MEFVVLGGPESGPTLSMDHRRFPYAGKFVMSNTGKAVARMDGEVLAAVAFSEDRTDETAVWLRYVSVRRDRQGEGLGPRLCRFVTDRIRDQGYRSVYIAVNNPVAYEALYRAGFGFTGRETGIAELVLVSPDERSTEAYRAGYELFADRDLDEANTAVLERHRDGDPPPIVEPPD
jgi:GNAT superfamily N-acetyltransferase